MMSRTITRLPQCSVALKTTPCSKKPADFVKSRECLWGSTICPEKAIRRAEASHKALKCRENFIKLSWRFSESWMKLIVRWRQEEIYELAGRPIFILWHPNWWLPKQTFYYHIFKICVYILQNKSCFMTCTINQEPRWGQVYSRCFSTRMQLSKLKALHKTDCDETVCSIWRFWVWNICPIYIYMLVKLLQLDFDVCPYFTNYYLKSNRTI